MSGHRFHVHHVELCPLQHVLVVMENRVGLVRGRGPFQSLGIELRYRGQVKARLGRYLPEMAFRVIPAADDADL